MSIIMLRIFQAFRVKKTAEDSFSLNVSTLQKDAFYASVSGKAFAKKVRLADEEQINRENSSGFLPLHLACYRGHLDKAKVLLKNGAELNQIDGGDTTALGHACDNKQSKIVEYLLQQEGIEESLIITPDHYSAFHQAVHKNDIHILQQLVEKYNSLPADLDGTQRISIGEMLNKPDESGLTVLAYACDKGCLETVRYLLSLPGININQTVTQQVTPLHLAVGNNFHKIVRVLLEDPRINRDAKTDAGKTALDLARELGHGKCEERFQAIPNPPPTNHPLISFD